MTPTLFGLLTAGLGLAMLWRANTLAMLQLVMLLSLMGGSAALVLGSLGGSTVQPAILALGLLALRCMLPGAGQGQRLEFAIKDSAFLLVFVLYGVAGAFILPRIFAGALTVTPLRPIPNGYIYSTFPLGFSAQNITTAVYMLATLIAGICAHVASQAPASETTIARTAATVAIVHALLGLSGVLLAGTAWTGVLGFFRNGFYAQLDQSLSGFVRMNGIWPEPAVFAAYGFAWLVFVTELWLRDVEPRLTGLAALVLASALLISTSTTAYIGLGAYALLLALRLLLLPGTIPASKALKFVSGALIGLAAILILLAVSARAASAFGDFVATFTVGKASSLSGLQRAFWAKQGLDSFLVSFGLGIGPGSFRSSSTVTAVIGSTGTIGTAAFVLHVLRVFKPLYRTSYARIDDPRRATGVAASWAALVMLIPSSFSAPSPDPGFVWALFGGIALALRPGMASSRPSSTANRLALDAVL